MEYIDAESVRAVNVPTFTILEWILSAITAVEGAEAAAARAEAAAAEALEADQAEAGVEDDED